jgi:hypothetical protein
MSRKSGIPVYQTLYAFAFVAFVATFSAVMFSSVLMWKTDRTSQARHPLMQTNDSPVTLFLNSSLRRDGSEPASERPPARRVRGALQAITASNNISHRPRKRTFQGRVLVTHRSLPQDVYVMERHMVAMIFQAILIG